MPPATLSKDGNRRNALIGGVLIFSGALAVLLLLSYSGVCASEEKLPGRIFRASLHHLPIRVFNLSWGGESSPICSPPFIPTVDVIYATINAEIGKNGCGSMSFGVCVGGEVVDALGIDFGSYNNFNGARTRHMICGGDYPLPCSIRHTVNGTEPLSIGYALHPGRGPYYDCNGFYVQNADGRQARWPFAATVVG